ncbi:MAG: phytanoyl-CoA dioxygenase family protein [Myxococcota bacterium]
MEVAEALRVQGFAVLPRVFASSETRDLLSAFDRLEARCSGLSKTTEIDGATFVMEPTGPSGAPRLQRVIWCGGAEPRLLEPGDDPRVSGLAARVLGSRDLAQLINQAHFKRPGDGVGFPMHQDAWNRRTGRLFDDIDGRGSYVQILLCLDDMTEHNGPLCFLPGSHAGGPRWLATSPEARRRHVEALSRIHVPVPVVAPAGSLVVFGPYVFHGSEPNRSGHPRRALVNGYALPGANRRVYPGAGLGRPVRASV